LTTDFLNLYYSAIDRQRLSISAAQGSQFAKEIAGDFNPIHDSDNKRFCVPGDLLFAIALQRYGLRQKMEFEFLSMCAAEQVLHYPEIDLGDPQRHNLYDDKERPVLAIRAEGEGSRDGQQIAALIRNYVRFSGQNFPHILVPLMERQRVMINPARPLVIYESMSFEIDNMNTSLIELALEETSLTVKGKRGTAQLHFSLSSEGRKIGSGLKTLVLSGLREYQQEVLQQLCERYLQSKQRYLERS